VQGSINASATVTNLLTGRNVLTPFLPARRIYFGIL